MKGAELILRYLAFRYDRQSYQKPLTSFLDQYSTKTKNLKADEVKRMANEFRATLSLVYDALGKLAFRMYEADATSPFNSALYDAEMIGFAETSNQTIRSHKYKPALLHAHVAKLFKSERFVNSIRQATSDELLVRTRIDMFTDHLNAFK